MPTGVRHRETATRVAQNAVRWSPVSSVTGGYHRWVWSRDVGPLLRGAGSLRASRRAELDRAPVRLHVDRRPERGDAAPGLGAWSVPGIGPRRNRRRVGHSDLRHHRLQRRPAGRPHWRTRSPRRRSHGDVVARHADGLRATGRRHGRRRRRLSEGHGDRRADRGRVRGRRRGDGLVRQARPDPRAGGRRAGGSRGRGRPPVVDPLIGYPRPTAVGVEDVDGDGDLDVAAGFGTSADMGVPPNTSDSGTVSILTNDGAGALSAAGPTLPVNAPSELHLLMLAGDDDPDLLIAQANKPAAQAIKVFPGGAGATFQAPTSYSSGGGAASSVDWGDFNEDGRIDLA